MFEGILYIFYKVLEKKEPQLFYLFWYLSSKKESDNMQCFQ